MSQRRLCMQPCPHKLRQGSAQELLKEESKRWLDVKRARQSRQRLSPTHTDTPTPCALAASLNWKSSGSIGVNRVAVTLNERGLGLPTRADRHQKPQPKQGPTTPENAKLKFSGERVSQVQAAGLDEARPKRGRADVQTNRPLVRQADTRQQFLRL